MVHHWGSMVHNRSSMVHHWGSMVNHRSSMVNHWGSMVHNRGSMVNQWSSMVHNRSSMVHNRSSMVDHRSSVVHNRGMVNQRCSMHWGLIIVCLSRICHFLDHSVSTVMVSHRLHSAVRQGNRVGARGGVAISRLLLLEV